MKYLSNINLAKNEIQNAVIQKLASAPTNPMEGQIYYDTVDDEPKYFNGVDWIAMNGLGATMTGSAIVSAINSSSSTIDDDNLSETVGMAITKAHDAVTVEDTTSINLTLDDQELSADAIFGSTAGTICEGNDARLSDSRTPKSHTHGSITNDGKIGSASGLIVKTTTGGLLSTLAQGSAGQYLQHDGTWSTPPTHTQNTDTGTSSPTFEIGSSGVKIKNSSGAELQVRNNADSDFADIRVKNLYVEGSTTQIDSNTVNIGDSNLVLNNGITTSAENSNGGISVKRLMLDNTTRKDAVLEYDTASEKWQSTFGVVSGTLVTAQIANKVVANVGNGSNTSIVITHNLNSRDCVVSVREASSPYALVMCDVEYTSLNTITLIFATAPTSNQYVATIIG
jgi:hypothetical protein